MMKEKIILYYHTLISKYHIVKVSFLLNKKIEKKIVVWVCRIWIKQVLTNRKLIVFFMVISKI